MKKKPTAEGNLPRDHQQQEGKLKRESTEIAKPYQPTPEELTAADAVCARRIKTPRVKVEGTVLSLDHANPIFGQAQLMAVLATGEVDFFWQILSQLGSVSVRDGKTHEGDLNFMVSVIKGIQPRDQLETMLAAQMAVVHLLGMNMASRLQNSFTLPQMESMERASNRLVRTFAAQVETLKHYRSSGEQKVTVEHVTVNQGGKAIVGNVTHGGEGASKKSETAP
jgi:hypothetical protein